MRSATNTSEPKETRVSHRIAPLTPAGRLRFVHRCEHRSIAHVAAEAGISASALHLPQTGGVEDLVAQHWEVLGRLDRSVLPHIIAGMDALRALRDVPADDLWAVIEKHRTSGTDTADETTDLLDAEWALRSRPTTDKQDEDFRAVPNTDVPAVYGSLLDQVVRVTRLREVQALVGFTRLSAPERRNLQPRNLVRLRSGPAEWVPVVEKRGEGVFLKFDEDRVRRTRTYIAYQGRVGKVAENLLDRDFTADAPNHKLMPRTASGSPM